MKEDDEGERGKKILLKQLCSLSVQRSFYFFSLSFCFVEENFSRNLLIGKPFLYRVKADVMHIILLR